MKNKVLRLAIVAVLVVAMVLSMAACNDPKPVDPTPVVTPTPTKTPDKTVAPSTPAPTKTPDVSTDEATLEAKYGITFPVAEDMKVSFVGDTAVLEVLNADKSVLKFGAKAPTYNDAFNAYKAGITVTAKVSGLTAEGGKIELNELKDKDDTALADSEWAYYFPTKAGTYTVVYTVKVAYDGEKTYGAYKPAKISETYSVTKVYEVGKKAITIESLSDAFEKSPKLAYPVATLNVGGKEQSNVQALKVLEELKLAGTDAKYGLSIDIVSADLTAYGTYPLTLVCLDGKNQKVDLATLVAPDFEITFKNGNRFVLTDAELAAAVAAQDDVNAAVEAGAKKEDIELGVATFTALSDASKTWFLSKMQGIAVNELTTNVDKAGAMNMKYKDLSRNGMAEEALKLAKVWNDKLQNAEDGKAFVTYMLSLSKKPVVIDGVPYATDYAFVVGKLTEAATKNAYITTALGLVGAYEKTVLTDFAKKFNAAVLAADFSAANVAPNAGFFDKATVEKFAKKVAEAQAAYDALVAGQEKLPILDNTVVDKKNPIDSANEIIGDAGKDFDYQDEGIVADLVDETESLKKNFARLAKASSEMTARYTAYATLVDGLDAYTGDKATKGAMTALLGYDFGKKMISNTHTNKGEAYPLPAHLGQSEASWVAFDVESIGAYVVFSTPMLFIENAVKTYKVAVDAFVALDAAIVSAQKDVITNLGSKIKFAADGNILVESFDGTKFVNAAKDTLEVKTETVGETTKTTTTIKQKGAKDITRLEALQKFIAEKAIVAIYVEGVPFADLAKKELSVVIAAALKEPVASVNDYIKDENAFLFDFAAPKAATISSITFTNLFAGYTMKPENIIVNKYAKGTTVVAASAEDVAIAADSLHTITFTGLVFAEGDVIEVVYNGITVRKTVEKAIA